MKLWCEKNSGSAWRRTFGWLIQVEYLSERKLEHERDRCTGAASAVIQALYQVETKISVYQSVYFPVLTYGHYLWVVTERKESWIQVAKMSFLRSMGGLSLRIRVKSSK